MDEILSLSLRRGSFWIRVFGRGFSVRNTKRYGLIFSERGGHEKYFMIGKWCFKYLKRGGA